MQQSCIFAPWPAPANVVALTTLRDVELSSLNLPNEPSWIKQVHGNTVVCVDDLKASLTSPLADAAIAFSPNSVCLVRTADCLPVFLCDQHGTQVAVVHCGWRSLAANILENTCKQFKTPLQQFMAWLGPAIGPQAFEVEVDVLDSFKAHAWDNQVLHSAFQSKGDGKWLGNLYALARHSLQAQGLLAENIYGGEWCTYSDPARFYSYRRSKDAGRMFNLIWRTS